MWRSSKDSRSSPAAGNLNLEAEEIEKVDIEANRRTRGAESQR